MNLYNQYDYQQIFFIKITDMNGEQEIDLYTYILNIQSIKMKVKFPCKMRLESHSKILTQEVSPNDIGKFIFNQQVTLTQEFGKTYFEVVAHLISQKGADYFAGTIKLDYKQMKHQEGELLIIPLHKWMDPQATCQLRVDQVISQKVNKPTNIEKSYQKDFPPLVHHKNHEFTKGNHSTKSQFQFPIKNNKQVQNWGRNDGNLSNYPKLHSPQHFKKSNGGGTYLNHNIHNIGDNIIDSVNRDKLVEAEVYKQSYQKLKQKYKKQAETAKLQLNKRTALQNNENNYRLEIMRIKLRNEEQEKALIDKNNRIKQLQMQVGTFQKKQLDLAYLKQQNDNKDYHNKMLEETIKTLNRDNDDLKALNKQRFEGEQGKIKQLRIQLDQLKQKFDLKELDLQKQIRSKDDIILQRQSQMRIKDDRIRCQQKFVEQLEKSIQIKTLEFERAQQKQRSQWKSKINDFNIIIQKLQRQKQKLQAQLKQSNNETEKIKSYLIKVEYDKKILNQQSGTYKQQLNEYKSLKQKYQELSRQHRMMIESNNQINNQMQKSLKTKQLNIQELTKQHHDQLEYLKKNNREIQQKGKNYQIKSLELQSQLQCKKKQFEKNKRNQENLNKDINQFKQKQKALQKTLKQKENEICKLTGEFDTIKQRSKSSDQISKQEIESLNEELQKYQRNLQSQYSKNRQISQRLSTLNEEIISIRLKCQQVEDNSDKNSLLSNQKYINLQTKLREKDRKLESNEATIDNFRKSEKQKMQNLQKLQLQLLKSSEKISSFEKSLKSLEQRNGNLENSLKIKQKEAQNLTIIKQQLQYKLTTLQDQLINNKNAHNIIIGQKNKNDKILELINKDIANIKQKNGKFQNCINDKDKQIDEIRKQLKKNKEDTLKNEMKNTNLKKEYDRFKQQLNQTLISTYLLIPQLSSSDLKTSHVSDATYRRQNSTETFSNNSDIISRIVSQNKQVKSSMSKLIQQNKILKSQNEKLNKQIFNLNGKSSNDMAELYNIISNLQDEIFKQSAIMQQSQIQFAQKINQLDQELDRKQTQIQELLAQVQEHIFTINSLKMNNEANGQHYELKQGQHKIKITELEEKISFFTKTLEQYELTQQQTENIISQNNFSRQNSQNIIAKKEKVIEQLQSEKRSQSVSIEQSKRRRKQLLQKISELQLKLNTEIQTNEKYKQQLKEEEHKNSDLKQFVANLMKQKQNAIKSDLSKSQQIIKLEMTISESMRQKETQYEEIQRIKKIAEDHKQSTRKLTQQIKELDALGSDQKGKFNKTIQKLKQAERDLKNTKQQIHALQQQYKISFNKQNHYISELKQDLQVKNKQYEQLASQYQSKKLQWTQNYQQTLCKTDGLNKKIIKLEEQLFISEQNYLKNIQYSESIQNELKGTKDKLNSVTQAINKVNEEIREKEESLFQFTGKLYRLQVSLENKQIDKNQAIENLNDQWNVKYDEMCREHEERAKLVEKQRTNLKLRIKQIEEEHHRTVAELRSMELDDGNFKKILEDKIKRLQEDRLSGISLKNNQIQRVSQQSKIHFQALKSKQAELRRLQHELQVARNTVVKLDLNKRDTQEKIRSINKVYQGQLQQIKRRQASNRTLKERIHGVQWDLEKELKKLIQNLGRKSISGQSKQSSQKLMNLLKNFQEDITQVIKLKFQEPK